MAFSNRMKPALCLIQCVVGVEYVCVLYINWEGGAMFIKVILRFSVPVVVGLEW